MCWITGNVNVASVHVYMLLYNVYTNQTDTNNESGFSEDKPTCNCQDMGNNLIVFSNFLKDT